MPLNLCVYFVVCTGLVSNHFLDKTSDVRAVISCANQYQALPLLFYFSSGRGESLGTRLVWTSLMSSLVSTAWLAVHVTWNLRSRLEVGSACHHCLDYIIFTSSFFLNQHHAKTKLSHFLTEKKKEGKFHSLVLALTLKTGTLRLNHSATRQCWRLRCTALSLTYQHYTCIVTNGTFLKNNSIIVIMSWWCNLIRVVRQLCILHPIHNGCSVQTYM